MTSKPWSDSTKRLIVVGIVLLFGLAIARFSQALAPLLVSVIIAYVLHLPVNWIARHTRIPRNLVAIVMYVTFYIVLALIPAALTPILIQQARRINLDLRAINEQLAHFISQPLVIFNLSLDPRDVAAQVTGALTDVLSPFATGAIGVLFGIAEGVVWIIFIFVVGLYLLLDADRIGIWLDNLTPPDYRHEIIVLRREIGVIWNSFFVGQLILCTIMGVTVGGATAILGIRSAFMLGLVAAVAELVPNIGHTVSAMVGVTVAFLEGSYLPVSNLWFALIVALVYIAITQMDINVLIPRIIGRRMHLSPAVVIAGLIAGASIGGVLGLLLAAPTLSSLRVLGSYIYRRLLDLEPYVLVSGEQHAPPPAPETGEEAKSTNPPDAPSREAT
jgi:predicted PurR-regulated permease PerM